MIIATRELQILESTGSRKVLIEIESPVFEEGAWNCRYRIRWPDAMRDSSGTGFDAIQALHTALQKIGVDIYMSRYHEARTLMWTNIGDGYGFPIPKNGRDLLIGLDKTFEG